MLRSATAKARPAASRRGLRVMPPIVPVPRRAADSLPQQAETRKGPMSGHAIDRICINDPLDPGKEIDSTRGPTDANTTLQPAAQLTLASRNGRVDGIPFSVSTAIGVGMTGDRLAHAHVDRANPVVVDVRTLDHLPEVRAQV